MANPITAQEQFEANLVYEALGRTLARWSHLEHYLGVLFQRATAMNEDVARNVFHSARSWRGRYDMLMGALEGRKNQPGLVESWRNIVGIANSYATFRNILAHDHVQLAPFATNIGIRALIIRPGTAGPTPLTEQPILKIHIQRAGENFLLLQAVVANALKWDGEDQLGSPERLNWLIAQLPNPPHSKTVAPTVAEQFLLGLERQPFPD